MIPTPCVGPSVRRTRRSLPSTATSSPNCGRTWANSDWARSRSSSPPEPPVTGDTMAGSAVVPGRLAGMLARRGAAEGEWSADGREGRTQAKGGAGLSSKQHTKNPLRSHTRTQAQAQAQAHVQHINRREAHLLLASATSDTIRRSWVLLSRTRDAAGSC